VGRFQKLGGTSVFGGYVRASLVRFYRATRRYRYRLEPDTTNDQRRNLTHAILPVFRLRAYHPARCRLSDRRALAGACAKDWRCIATPIARKEPAVMWKKTRAALLISSALVLPALAQQPGTGQNQPFQAPFVQIGNHQHTTGPSPVVSSCGTAPVLFGSDNAFKFQTGNGATACTITFAAAWQNGAPICSVDAESVTASYTVSPTALTITATIGGVVHHVQCTGRGPGQ
jgi:hypothetical protein